MNNNNANDAICNEMKVLLTGGAGYIGSHVAVELLNVGHEIVIADDLSNSSETVLQGIREITGKDFTFYNIDISRRELLDTVFERENIDIVIHLAGYKAVNEAIRSPLKYYRNNITATVSLIETMDKFEVHKIILSSSANVYGDSDTVPVNEGCDTGKCTNPYGRTKWIQEELLKDVYTSDPRWHVVILRYFNPAGAHPSGLIGEIYGVNSSNLMPSLALAADGKIRYFKVLGDCYDTPDGTCIRDYIHITDLAKGHVASLKRTSGSPDISIYNLGTGTGYSVLEVIRAFESVCGRSIPYKIEKARAGDVAKMYACCDKAAKELGWQTEYNLQAICESAWNWQLIMTNQQNLSR